LVDHGRASSDQELDGITGATVTSRAAVETINRASAAAAGQILGLPVESNAAGDARGSPFTLELVYLLAAFGLGVVVLLEHAAATMATTALIATSFRGLLGTLDSFRVWSRATYRRTCRGRESGRSP
jgi:hypothetical protein